MEVVLRYLLFICFAIFAPAVVTGTTGSALLYPTVGFLIGEDAPVYVADRQGDNVVYTKLEKGIVKKAMDRWEKLKSTNTKYPIRARREVNITKRESPDEDGVLYPSILAVLDFGKHLPNANPDKEQEVILDRIIYGMAYFNGVDIDLRNILNPKVPLRIVAIIINRSFSNSWPYMSHIDDGGWWGLDKALNPMLEYWRNLGKNSNDFPIGSYDIVAHLTDTYGYYQKYVMYAATSSKSPPCNQKDQIAGLIVYDELLFDSIRTTVTKMSYIFGDTEDTWAYTWDFRPWTLENFNNIYTSLKGQTCMKKPKEYHPPGNPVATILPGELYPYRRQCEAHGWNEINYSHCWGEVQPGKQVKACKWLYCTNYATDIPCRNIWGYSNPTLPGTVCSEKASGWHGVCIQGACVQV